MSSSIENKQHFYRYVIGDYVFDTSLFTLSNAGGTPITVERKPLEVLAVLLENLNQVLSKEELLDAVWPSTYTVENVLANAIAKLRKALGKEAQRLITHQRIGYRFSGEVERTVIGQRLVSELSLNIDQPVPQRPNFRLVKALSSATSREVWRAKHHKTGETRIFKFVSDGAGLQSIKREITLFRVLSSGQEQPLPIGKVLDWNFDTEPFFVECEDAGDDLKRWASKVDNLTHLSLEERIDLAIHICDAVNQVHELGILHCDIKPSNIIVQRSEFGFSVKLIDFGSGFLLNRMNLERLDISPLGMTDQTGSQHHTTPMYLAPELIENQNLSSSIRSDIYSLGVVIYQLITGQLGIPMGSDWPKNIDDPLVQDDIYQATNSNPTERFVSAADLAKNFRELESRRQQQSEAEQLKTRLLVAEENARKAKVRRPWIIASGFILFVGLCVSLVLGYFTQQSLEQAELSAAREEAANNFLVDVINGADPRDSATGPDASIAEALSRASALADERFADKPLQQSRVYKMLASVYSGLHMPQAINFLEKNAQLIAETYGEASDEYRLARYELALELIPQSKIQEAIDVIKELDNWPDSDRKDINIARLRSKALLNLLQSNMTDAASYNKKLLSLIKKPTSDIERRIRFIALFDLSQAYSRIEGKQQLAVDTMAQLLSPDYDKTGIQPYHFLRAEGMYGFILAYNSEYDKAESVLLAALPKYINFYGETHLNTIELRSYLGNVYLSTHRYSESANTFATLKAIACKKFGNEDVRCGLYAVNEGSSQLELGHYRMAVKNIRYGRKVLQKQFPERDSPFYQGTNFLLGAALLEVGELEEVGQLIEGLDENILSQAESNTEWDLMLPIIRLRYMLAQRYDEELARNLQTLIQDLEMSQSTTQITIDRMKRSLIKPK